MKKNILNTFTFMIALIAFIAPHEINGGRGGYFAGGLFTGAVLGSAISRESYRSDREYYWALRDENQRLREENADLRAELRAAQRAAKTTKPAAKRPAKK